MARSFVACLQNHDQVGNRALGERTARLLNKGQLMIGAVLVLTSPYVPLLFQGEEGLPLPFLTSATMANRILPKGYEREGSGNSPPSSGRESPSPIPAGSDGKWENRRADDERASSLHPTQKEAADSARKMLRNQGGGELTVKGLDGKIVSKDTIPPRKQPLPSSGYGTLERQKEEGEDTDQSGVNFLIITLFEKHLLRKDIKMV